MDFSYSLANQLGYAAPSTLMLIFGLVLIYRGLQKILSIEQLRTYKLYAKVISLTYFVSILFGGSRLDFVLSGAATIFLILGFLIWISLALFNKLRNLRN